MVAALCGESSGDHRHHLISGDFNGDGYLDNAYASVVSENEWNLVLHLDVLGDEGEIIVLDEHTPDVPVDEIWLKVFPSAEYETFCGLAPGECKDRKPAKVILTADGIYMHVLEASASIIFWDAESRTFVRHWLAD